MLVPKLRLHSEERNGEPFCTTKYYVWDTDDCAYVVDKVFSFYDTKEECQAEIDFANQFSIVKGA